MTITITLAITVWLLMIIALAAVWAMMKAHERTLTHCESQLDETKGLLVVTQSKLDAVTDQLLMKAGSLPVHLPHGVDMSVPPPTWENKPVPPIEPTYGRKDR